MKIVNVFLAYHGYSSDHKKNCVLCMNILQRMKRLGNEDSSSDSPGKFIEQTRKLAYSPVI